MMMMMMMTSIYASLSKRHLASDAIWVKKKPKKPKPRALFLAARKPQLNPGVGGTGRQPLNMYIYIYIYTHMRTLHMQVCMCIYIYICIHTCSFDLHSCQSPLFLPFAKTTHRAQPTGCGRVFPHSSVSSSPMGVCTSSGGRSLSFQVAPGSFQSVCQLQKSEKRMARISARLPKKKQPPKRKCLFVTIWFAGRSAGLSAGCPGEPTNQAAHTNCVVGNLRMRPSALACQSAFLQG